MNSLDGSQPHHRRSRPCRDSGRAPARAATLCLLLGTGGLPNLAFGAPVTSDDQPPPPAAPAAADGTEAVPPPVVIEQQQPPYPASAVPRGLQSTPTREPTAIDVTVVGRRQVSNRGASDFQIRVDQLADVPRANASELLKLAPGILLTSEGGEGHAEQVFLRGFDAREGQDIEFSVNGVPINEAGNLHGNGYADTHFIIPELVDQLRVVEGPFDPRQGNFAVAGSASYDLGLGDR